MHYFKETEQKSQSIVETLDAMISEEHQSKLRK